MQAKYLITLIVSLGLLMGLTTPVFAQDEPYKIHVRKDFGYGMGNTIQGRFSIRLVGEEADVEQVSFFLDDELLATVESSPYRYQFSTEDFEPGLHRLFAEVELWDGSVVITSAAQFNFLSESDANRQTTWLLVGIGGAVIGAILIAALIQMFMTRKTSRVKPLPGSPRNYGMLGGAICPRCGRAFPRHIWGINLVVGKLDRCEHCGKWFLATRAAPEALRAAEEAEQKSVVEDDTRTTGQNKSPDTLEDTRFIDEI